MDLIPLLTALWQPAHFYLSGGLRCAWQFEAERTLPWEIFRGRLVEPRQTRETKTFLTWNLLPVENGAVAAEPLLSLLLDEPAGEVHVTRGLKCRVWTPIDAAGGIESRQTEEWIRELVGTLPVRDENLADEVRILIHQAIAGVSRLPLTSVEAPLPQFTFGQLAYLPRSLVGVDPRLPRRGWRELLQCAPDADEGVAAKLLETLLRTASADEVAGPFAEWLGRDRLAATFRRTFNDVSLSPYTGFVAASLAALAAWKLDDEIDILSGLLVQITRHLTAYDLVLFHYRGANFPDALLLDEILLRLADLAAGRVDAFMEESAAGRRRRRAIRMGCLLRAQYEGHAVPDQPTSPGENLRILPPPYDAVPDERTRRLYDDAPISSVMTPLLRDILTRACLDLTKDAELREGGMALFIDRPLGFFKAPAEVDQTPLLSYVAFSRHLATRRSFDLEKLAARLSLDVPALIWPMYRERLLAMNVAGLPVDRVPDSPRPAVTLADARKVADDFVVVRTTRSSLEAFWAALAVDPQPGAIIARIVNVAGQPVMAICDDDGRTVAEFDGDWSQGSIVRNGVEVPKAGIRTAPPAP